MLGRKDAIPALAGRLANGCQPEAVSSATSIWKTPLRESAHATYSPWGPAAIEGVVAGAGLLLTPPREAEPANSVQRPW